MNEGVKYVVNKFSLAYPVTMREKEEVKVWTVCGVDLWRFI